MSDKSIAAPAGLARRSFVAALAGGAALAATSLRPATASSSDASLIAAIDRLTELRKLLTDADAERDLVWKEAERRSPAWPAELRWRPGDLVAYERGRHEEGGKFYSKCSISEIFKVRDTPVLQWMFRGSETELEALTDADFGVSPHGSWEPKPHIQYLYEPRPHALKQKRLDQIVAAWDKYESERDAISEELCVSEMEDRAEDLWEKVNEQLKLIVAMHVESLTGLRVKLDLLASMEGEPDFKKSEDELLASIVRDFGSPATV